MTYKTLDKITRQAANKVLGMASENLDKWLVTCDFNEGIEIEGYDLGTSVELSFDPPISPFTFFTSDVVFYVCTHEDGIGDMQVFFGDSCYDVAAAEAAASEFLGRDASDGWYIDEEFSEDAGLHLMREFCFDPESESELLDQLTACFSELCEADTSDELRSFIHYFEA